MDHRQYPLGAGWVTYPDRAASKVQPEQQEVSGLLETEETPVPLDQRAHKAQWEIQVLLVRWATQEQPARLVWMVQWGYLGQPAPKDLKVNVAQMEPWEPREQLAQQAQVA
jgi:hypothetical protein